MERRDPSHKFLAKEKRRKKKADIYVEGFNKTSFFQENTTQPISEQWSVFSMQ